ncbi:purine nucleoside phosphorylase [Campylobacter sputorum subsp. bubulus]|uniref:Purine nucleoside phosphorylase n=3 Tax=Campylobacter sputorum TaxID=206 RepID=A0A381DKV2_9BACT|nr:M99 family carboxypeptidase catalytic domain-containing protein [Campylobacter sputorum]SUX09792.1 purine nucleoside phosphorylase [Campylobacter sputorum subsp. bubulus]ASM34619.1 putative carboxypeptidase, M99 family [Campylobacter sputorum aubsp. sputorum RM3237]KAB0581166.1 hypothetical protein F7P64_07380 [Campylobacter sputorum subsp. sputorum]QEL04810.1 peptidoglycan peptidase 1 [Campylobacter sputorum subsp. sputorum]SUX11296.1 purine nucleoside phosphorylase [Campylobacter sputorum
MSYKLAFKTAFFLLLFLTSCFPKDIYVKDLDFDLVKKGSFESNNTMLLIGGIQGDEPGGFNAANIIINEYEILNGSVWVVPNLNLSSILANSRGLSGDMNRKFAQIDKNDPDYKNVMKIQNLILDDNVSLVLNLHDGSGFYRHEYINDFENPKRWGNSTIIDQNDLNGSTYGNLYENASNVAKSINAYILDDKHKFHVKNTKTKDYDKEMQKSLTYFSIRNDKAAYANEASKSLKVEYRVFYHLLAIEKYMDIMGIKFKRNFEITPQNISEILQKEISISLFDDKFYLTLKNPRDLINFVPMSKNSEFTLKSSDKLVGFVKTDKDEYKIYHGNRHLTTIKPEYFEYSNLINRVNISVDNVGLEVPLNTKIKAKSIKIEPINGVRVNIIGLDSKKSDEADILITRKDMNKKFSIDKAGEIYRVEFYELGKNSKDKFIGMILVDFKDVKPSKEKAFEITIVKDEKNNIFRLDDKFFAFIDDIKSKLNFVPMQKNDVKFSSNLNSLNLKKENYSYKIYNKNKVLTTLNPEYFEYSDILDGIYINVDENINSFVNFGTKIKAKSIKIEHINGVRVNVIGYNSGKNDESGIFIRKKDLDKKFSIDKAGNIYRVEFYELCKNSKDKFIGMILVEFE